jgi:hypothetical protein
MTAQAGATVKQGGKVFMGIEPSQSSCYFDSKLPPTGEQMPADYIDVSIPPALMMDRLLAALITSNSHRTPGVRLVWC